MRMRLMEECRWMAGLVAIVAGLAWGGAVWGAERAQPDPLCPGDAEAILTINVRQMVQSPLTRKRALPQLQTALAHNQGVQKMLSAAEIDPLRDVERITVCATGNPGKDGRLVVIVRGKFKPEKIEAVARQHPEQVKTLQEGSTTLYEIQADRPLYATFVDGTTFVATSTRRDTLAVARSAGRPATPVSPDLRAALDQLSGKESVWVALLITRGLKGLMQKDQEAQDFAESLKYLAGKIEVAEDAQAHFVIHTADARTANQLYQRLDELNQVLGFFVAGPETSARVARGVLETLKIATEKTDVTIRFRLSDDMIEKAMAAAKVQPKK